MIHSAHDEHDRLVDDPEARARYLALFPKPAQLRLCYNLLCWVGLHRWTKPELIKLVAPSGYALISSRECERCGSIDDKIVHVEKTK